MWRTLGIAIGVLLGCVHLSLPAFAQRGSRGGGGGARGFSGGFHGGGSTGGFRGGGGYRGGSRGNFGGNRGFGGRYNGYRGLGGLYYYAGFYYGGYYDPFGWDSGYGWDPGYGYSNPGPYPSYAPSYGPSSPSVVIVSNEAPAPAPQVIVQQPASPGSSAWGASPQAQKYQDPLFLVAMHDGTIRAVLAYWVDGATVHYVTMDHEQKQTPLTSIDRDLSERLNRERNVAFRLPG